jgi:hypothetical protein
MSPTSGTYTLEVSAAGYETRTSQVEVTVHPAVKCGCGGATFEPDAVSLDPVDTAQQSGN